MRRQARVPLVVRFGLAICGPFLFLASCKRHESPSEPKLQSEVRSQVASATLEPPTPIDIVTSAPNTLYRLAGNLAGGGTLDGRANQARFRQPCDVTSDGEGSLYIADSKNDAIRRIQLATAMVTTVAGLAGEPGQTDGESSRARFRWPRGLVSDRAGNIYVSDTGNQAIRQIVVKTGQVTTLAAVPDACPVGIDIDKAGNLYFADEAFHTIRRIEIATRQVTILAGKPNVRGQADGVGAEARFAMPMDVAYDPSGFLYVADTANRTIRKIVLTNGQVTTVAGTGQQAGVDGSIAEASFGTPASLMVDGLGHLYVVDGAIRLIDLTSGVVSTIAGGRIAREVAKTTGEIAIFEDPRGATLGGSGALYVTELNRARVRRLDLVSREISTAAGPPAVKLGAEGHALSDFFTRPVGLAVDSEGNVYAIDQHSIKRIDSRTRAVTTLVGNSATPGTADGTGSEARFDYPRAMTSDDRAHLYVADLSRIRQITLATGKVETLAGSVLGTADGQGKQARFSSPSGIAYDGRGNLYLSETRTIRKVVIATATVSTIAGEPLIRGSDDGIGAAAHFNDLAGIACDGSHLYVSEYSNHTIRRVTLATQQVETLAGAPLKPGSTDAVGRRARFNLPRAVALDNHGGLFVAEGFNHVVRRLELATGRVTTVVGSKTRIGVLLGPLPASLSDPTSLAVLRTGEIAIADESAIVVARF